MEYILLSLVFLTTPFSAQDMVKNHSASEYTSVRNLPVIMENERIGKNQCRLHLDNDQQVEVACKHESYSS